MIVDQNEIDTSKSSCGQQVNDEQALMAVRQLLLWMGQDPDRHGLCDTPKRVLKSFEERLMGYHACPHAMIKEGFETVEGYDAMIMVNAIDFESTCEHHLLPISGQVHIAYWPDNRLIGLSKLARIVDIYAKRLQLQERLTVDIASALDISIIKPKGVGVAIKAKHACMACRGVNKLQSATITSHLTGCFKSDPDKASRFFEQCWA